uniref:Putative ovule protein n=1 Tax=Solanum chacoense TaxID=4108 RepID=A0A0V0GZN1_SOLCH
MLLLVLQNHLVYVLQSRTLINNSILGLLEIHPIIQQSHYFPEQHQVHGFFFTLFIALNNHLP